MASELKKELKSRAHSLKPTVWLGQQGLTPAVLAEIDQALEAHELIKIKVPGVERAERNLIVAQIVTETLAELVQIIGQIATLYRRKEDGSTNNTTKKAAKKR